MPSSWSLLEVVVIALLYTDLKKDLKTKLKNYFDLVKFSAEEQEEMLQINIFRNIIKEMIESGDYDVQGIATYTGSYSGVVSDVVSGLNPNPSVSFFASVIKLHASSRKELYRPILKKIVCDFDIQK